MKSWLIAGFCWLAVYGLPSKQVTENGVLSKQVIDWIEERLTPLESECLVHETPGWWKYKWCHKSSIKQLHQEVRGKNKGRITSEWSAGAYDGKVKLGYNRNTLGTDVLPDFLSYHYGGGQKCTETGKGRSTEVRILCCSEENMNHIHGVWISSLIEVKTCTYLLSICANVMCELKEKLPILKHQNDQKSKWTIKHDSNDNDVYEEVVDDDEDVLMIDEAERLSIQDEIKSLFYHGYDSYMMYAFPMDELRPLTCSGENFDLTAGNMLTLIDNLDTLVILGNYSEFARAVTIVEQNMNFDIDKTVSVFETTIRVIGGLLSAHMLATELNIMPSYRGGLLRLALDLGDRLMPAFNTTTSIPYGTVNLRYGVPRKETTEACTAAAGSLSLEFGMLSVLSGDAKYGQAARSALKAIFDLRSTLGLVGRHIDVMTGKWTEPLAGIGSNIDSMYEYYLKHYIVFGDDEMFGMFQELYRSVLLHLRIENTWYIEADMHRGLVQRRQFNNLQAFWPGMQTLVGDTPSATRTLNAFLRVWNEFGFTPEDFSIDRWAPLSGGTRRGYPLRPELAESVYYMSVTTQSPTWFLAGKDILDSITKVCRVRCGFASIQDIKKKSLHDNMPSFFLSELLKYLYLLFDTSNFVREDVGGNYVFTTEAHLIPVRLQYQQAAREMKFSFPARNTNKVQVLPEGKEWGVPSLSAEMIDAVQCPKPSLESDTTSEYFASDPRNRLGRHVGYELETRIDPVGHMPSEGDEDSDEDEGARVNYLRANDSDDPSWYKVTQDSHSFLIDKEGSGECLEITNLGTKVATIRLVRGKKSRMIFLDTERSEFSFQAIGVISKDASDSCPSINLFLNTDQSPAIALGLSVSEFGAENYVDRSINAPLVLAAQPQGCYAEAYPPVLVRDKLVVVHRGACMFEEKAKLAEASGALGVIVIQNKIEEPVFFMSRMMISSWFRMLSSRISCFMVTKSQGELIENDLKRGSQLRMDIAVSKVTNKDGVYPWGGSYKDKLTIMASPSWGVRMVKQGQTWSLMILKPNEKTSDI